MDALIKSLSVTDFGKVNHSQEQVLIDQFVGDHASTYEFSESSSANDYVKICMLLILNRVQHSDQGGANKAESKKALLHAIQKSA